MKNSNAEEAGEVEGAERLTAGRSVAARLQSSALFYARWLGTKCLYGLRIVRVRECEHITIK